MMSRPELQDILAEFENRISFIENSMPNTSDQQIIDRLNVLSERVSLMEQTEPSPHRWGTQYLTPKQCDIINQVKAGYLYLQGKVNELFESRKTEGFTIKE